MLENISIYIRISIILTSVLMFGKIIIEEKNALTTAQLIKLFIIISVTQTIIYIYCDGTVKTFLMLLTNLIVYKKIYNLTFFKSLFIAFLYMIVLIIPDALELFILTNIFGMDKEYCYNIFASSVLSNIIVCILLTIVTLILKKPLRKIIQTEISDNIKVVLLSIVTLIPILLFFYTIISKYKFSNDIIQYLIAMLVLATILFTLIRQTIEHNKIKREYDNLLEFMTTYENEIEKQRILRHETKNEFLAIRAKICDNQENEEIVEYIDEILKEKIKVKQEQYAKFGYLPPNGIKGLCYFKTQVAEEKNIKVSLNISKRIKESNIYKLSTKEQRDFGRILGVLLDNAIESSLDSNEKQIGIEAYKNSNNEFKMIISNSYKNNIDKNKIGIEKFSTKGKNRGHGLLLVKHIINENKIFDLITDIQDNLYVQTIKIKKV